MEIELKTADTSGTFEIAAGHGLLVEPVNGKAAIAGELKVRVNNEAGRELVLVSDRLVRMEAWTRLVAFDCVGGEQWRVYRLTEPGDSVGPASSKVRPVQLFGEALVENDTLASGDVYALDDLGTTGAVNDTSAYQASEFRRFVLSVAYGGFSGGAGTPTVKAQLHLCEPTGGAMTQGKKYELTLANAPATGEGLALFEFGEGVGEETAADVIKRGMVWPHRIGVTLSVENTTADEVTIGAAGFRAELWGYP